MHSSRANTPHLTTLARLAFVVGLVSAPLACLEADDGDVEASDLRAYNAITGTFEVHNEGSVWAQNTRVKSFVARVEALSQFEVSITKQNGYNTDFELIFSPTPVVNPTSRWGDGSTACANHGTGQNKAQTCTVNVPNGGQYAYVLVRAVNDTYASDFALDRSYHGYCPDKSCYEEDEIRVANLTQMAKKPLINMDEPLLLDGQSAIVEIHRSHSNLIIDAGVKLKPANNDNDTIEQVLCGGANDWVNNKTTCVLSAATEDGRIHVPIKLTNNNKANRAACVIIKRSGAAITTQTDPDGRPPCP